MWSVPFQQSIELVTDHAGAQYKETTPCWNYELARTFNCYCMEV